MDPIEIIVIHPEDSSTEFLKNIYSFLKRSFNERVRIIKIGFDDQAHDLVKIFLRKSTNVKVLFLGHGTSYSLHGAKNGSYSNDKFILKEELNIFRNTELVCLSCKSAEILKDNKEFSSIGFGDIPTQIDEVIGAQEFDITAYSGVNESTLDSFRKIIVNIISNSIYEWIRFGYNIRMLSNRINLRLSKKIIQVKLTSNDKDLIDLLVQMKDEIHFHQLL